jgi:hypothetical protein
MIPHDDGMSFCLYDSWRIYEVEFTVLQIACSKNAHSHAMLLKFAKFAPTDVTVSTRIGTSALTFTPHFI